MNITEMLDRPIAYHRVFVTLTGSVKAAILLSQAVYWQKRAKQADGWWYKTTEEWQDETGLTRHEQDKARKDCEKYLKTDLRDVPARLYWHVDEDALSADLIAESGKSSLTESGKLDSRFSANINKNTETTTETTTKPAPTFSNLERTPDTKSLSKSDFPIGWKLAHDEPITETDLQSAELVREAPLQFEKAFGFGTLPWDSTRDWEKLRKFITEIYRTDRMAFGRYIVWRAGEGKYSAMSNKQIRTQPSAFMDTGWPEFAANDKGKKSNSPAPVKTRVVYVNGVAKVEELQDA